MAKVKLTIKKIKKIKGGVLRTETIRGSNDCSGFFGNGI